jgi:hypothetical protein
MNELWRGVWGMVLMAQPVHGETYKHLCYHLCRDLLLLLMELPFKCVGHFRKLQYRSCTYLRFARH